MSNKPRWVTLMLCVSVALLAGCQSNQPANQTEPAATSSSGGAQSSRPRQSTSENRPISSGGAQSSRLRQSTSGSQPMATASHSASTPQVKTVTVTAPAGTGIPIRLDSGLSSATAQTGSTFTGTLARALVVGGVEVAPAGSRVAGSVTNAVSGGRLSRPAELALTLTSLTPTGGQAVPISTTTWSASGQSRKKRNIEMIGGGAGVGALIGALAGHGKGAAIGAAVGAGAGTAGAAFTGQKQIVLQAETPLTFKLTAPLTFTEQK